ncbi:MAG: nucleotidyltransferase family protein [Cyanobium sp.]
MSLVEPQSEPLIEPLAEALPSYRGSLQAANLPPLLRPELLPALEILVQQVRPQGLWLFGSWARGTASRRSDVDVLVMGLEHLRLLDAYDVVLEALLSCPPMCLGPRMPRQPCRRPRNCSTGPPISCHEPRPFRCEPWAAALGAGA